jgi:hypothetical protein
VERLRVFFYQRHLLTGREQSTFSVWSSPSWTRRRLLDALTRELRRIAASEYRMEVDSGRVCLSLAGTLHRNIRVEKKWHYCFWTKDPNPHRLSSAGRWRKSDIAIAIVIAGLFLSLLFIMSSMFFCRAKLICRLHTPTRPLLALLLLETSNYVLYYRS